nr:RecName: Full=Oxygen-evolving enhancer protein 2; Short=OEE2; AltName: Full=23 kDa subunit of oxygen evolving system of photosystem II; AltName: Full=23 kDa thylakoid membrane protein; AltName: Full=OEC 23 kDa subunit [Euglena gracilis]
AYGEGANVFGKRKETDQFFEISGDGWSGKL